MALSKYDLLIAEKTPAGEYMFIADHYKNMGTYKTKERTLEVLDEIQKIIRQDFMLHIDKSQHNSIEDIANPKFIVREINSPTKVYEMPLE